MPVQRINTAAPLSQQANQGRLLYVLYVEDDDVNWSVASLELSSKYNLVRARTSREAFAALAQHTFHVVLMDIELAGSDLNGMEITSVIKGKFTGTVPEYAREATKYASTPIIFVTAYAARYSKDDLVAVGGDDLITKPVNFTALTLAVSRSIARKLRM